MSRTCTSTNSPCPSYPDSRCVVYSGSNLLCTGVKTNDRLDAILAKIDAAICAGIGGSSIFLEPGFGIDITGVGNSTNPYIIANTMTANSGLSMNSPLIRLGQTIGQSGNPAALLVNTEIPLGDFSLIMNNKTGIGSPTSSIQFSTTNSPGFSSTGILLTSTNTSQITFSANSSSGELGNVFRGQGGNLQGLSGYSLANNYLYLADVRGNTTSANVLIGGQPSQNWLVSGDTQIGAFGTKNTSFGGIGTPTANVDVAASTITSVPLRIRAGVDPSSNFLDGSIWQASNHFYGRLNGVTKQLDNDYNITPADFIQNQFFGPQATANFWIDGHGRIDDYLSINNSSRLVKDSTNTLSVSTFADSTLGSDIRARRYRFWCDPSNSVQSPAYISSTQGNFLDLFAIDQVNINAPTLTFVTSGVTSTTPLIHVGGAYPLKILGATGNIGEFCYLDLFNANAAGDSKSTATEIGFSANRTTSGKTKFGNLGIEVVDFSDATYKGDITFKTVNALVNTGLPTEQYRIKYDGRIVAQSLKTGSTAPTTTGTTKMVITDTLGVQSFTDIPTSGTTYSFGNGITESGGAVKLGGNLSQNTTINAGSVYNLSLANMSTLAIDGSIVSVSVGGYFQINLAAAYFEIDGLINLSGQNRLLGIQSSDNQVGYITAGTGITISGGTISATATGGNIYNTNGTLTGNRTVDMSTFNLTFNPSGGGVLTLGDAGSGLAIDATANTLTFTDGGVSKTFFKLSGYTSASDGDVWTLNNHLTGEMGWSAGGGSGVTSFSSGNLAPLFTTSVATATTTPALSFSLTNAGAHTYFGNNTGSTAAPAYKSNAALTKTDDTNITLTLGGAPTTSLLEAVSLTLGWTGVLATTRGGTGLGSIGTANQIIRVNAGATALEYFTPTYISAAITSLNTLTAATQTFVVGTAGSDFNISSSVSTHTFNIPDSSLTARGFMSTNAQSFAGVKTFDVGIVVNESGAASDFRVESDGNANAIQVDGTNNRVGIFTASPGFPFDITGNTRIQSGSMAIGTSPTGASPLTLGGSGWTSSGLIMLPTINATVASSPSIIGVTGTIIEAGSGTHAVISALNLSPPTITNNGATVTNAATLYISGAPSTTVTASLDSIFVASGSTRLNGDMFLGSINAYTSGGYGVLVRNVSTGRTETVDTSLVQINTQAGTTYTLALSDKDGMVRMSNASANTLTVPTNASVAFPIGSTILVRQIGAGQTTISPAGGVTIDSADGAFKARVQNSLVTLIKEGTNNWSLSGDLTV